EKVFISRECDLSFLQPEPGVIIDAGANVGYASVFFAETFPKARIIAIEPEPANFALLQQNTAPYANVTPVRAAIWPHAASVSIENPNDEAWAFRVQEGDRSNGNTIRGVSVPELVAEHGISSIDIFKIDIEGAEKELFQPGCESWLKKTQIL